MSSNKLKKFLLLLALGLFSNQVDAAGTSTPYARNGIVYVLLSDDFNPSTANCNSGLPGVYRMSDDKGEPTTAWKLYDDVTSARGLTVNQEKNTSVFLLNSTGGTWTTMDPGKTPSIANDDDTCDLWVSVVEPTESNMAGTWKYAFGNQDVTGAYAKARSGHAFDSVNWRYWYNEPGSHNGTSYDWICRFGGPAGVANFNGVSGGGGTPMWKGTNNGEIRHKNYSSNKKIIIPCNFGAIGRYLYATKYNNDYAAGTEMNGTQGKKKDGTIVTKPTISYTQANKMGDAWNTMLYPSNSSQQDIQNQALSRTSNNSYALQRNNSADIYFGCVIKMIYSERNNSLNLRKGTDKTNSNWPSKQSLNQHGLNNVANATGLLETTDYKAIKYFGKWCGDACIPGSGLDAEAQDPIINEINVVTTTTDSVYGFNPKGKPNKTDKTAMLRVVDLAGGSHSAININNFNNLTNKNYLSSKGTINDLKNFGASSNFSGNNFLYGSFADKFVVQDSWWGKGGIAYEYDKSTKIVKKLDYMNAGSSGLPVSTTNCGTLYGDIDAIAVDGDAYLYALKTEGEPTNDACETPGLSGNLSTGWYTIGGKSAYVEVGPWKKGGSEGSTSAYTVSSPSSGCWKEIKIRQKVYKRVYRYKEGQSLSLNNDCRGEIFVGNDYYVGYLRYPSYTVSAFAPQGSSKTKVKDLHAELAVVNVADAPITFNGSDEHYVAVKDSPSFKSGNMVQEDSNLTFKIEGYKPKIDGTQRYFKTMGSYKFPGDTNAESVKLNNIHNNSTSASNNDNSGTMLFDENSDGVYTGFPSSMFESTSRKTSVYWYIYQVQDDTAKYIVTPPAGTAMVSMANVIKKCIDGEIVTSNSSDGLCTKSFTFNQPGHYIVQAKIAYWTFSNFGSALRPSDLTPVNSGYKVTKPFLVNIYASDLKYNQSPSYITNVTTRFDYTNKKSGRYTYSGISTNAPESGCDLETKEGQGSENQNHFGDLRIEFDAEFFGLKEDYTSGKFETYDGIGVWDYNYYQAIYKKMFQDAAYKINTLFEDNNLYISSTNPYTIDSYHVYNFINGSIPNNKMIDSVSDSSYNSNSNQGILREFTDTTKNYQAGTCAKGDLRNCDKAFIQYALYLRKLDDGNSTPDVPQKDTAKSLLKRGEVIASGTIVDTKLTSRSDYVFNPIYDSRGINRKYHVGFTVTDIDSRIFVPRDPNKYIVDIELIYPRVFWKLEQNSDKTRNLSSSIVPYNSDSGGYAPVHVLSNLTTTPKTYDLFNVNNLAGGIYDNDKSVGSFTLCVRDSQKPEFFYRSQAEEKNGTNYVDPVKAQYFNVYSGSDQGIIYESTGDNLRDGLIDYGFSDNNPFLSFTKNHNINTIIATSTAKDINKGIKIYYQNLILSSDVLFDKNASKNKTLKLNISNIRDVRVRQTGFNDLDFYQNNGGDKSGDNWRIYVTYRDTIRGISGLTPSGNSYEFKPEVIAPENWIGTLDYAAYGTVYDGYGVGNTISNGDVLHCFYAKAFEGKDGYPSFPSGCDRIDIATRTYMERWDNDPPSIGIELISQTDNRKWDFQLIEGVEDDAPFKTSNLAICKLTASCSKLLENTSLPNNCFGKDITGITNVYLGKDGKPAVQSVMPKVLYAPYVMYGKLSGIKDENIPTFRKSSRLIINVDIFDNCGFEDLLKAEITITDDGKEILKKDISNKAKSHNFKGELIDTFKNAPRGTFAIDLPSQVKDGNQVSIKVYAKDSTGNERGLEIPVKIIDSSYEARVIEHSEKKN